MPEIPYEPPPLAELLPMGLAPGDTVELDTGKPGVILKVTATGIHLVGLDGKAVWTTWNRLNYRPSLDEIARRAAVCRSRW